MDVVRTIPDVSIHVPFRTDGKRERERHTATPKHKRTCRDDCETVL